MLKTGAPTELATQRQSLMRTRRTAAASQMGLTASLYRSSERLDESCLSDLGAIPGTLPYRRKLLKRPCNTLYHRSQPIG